MEIESMLRIMSFNFGSLFWVGLIIAREGKGLVVLFLATLYGLHFVYELIRFERFKQEIQMKAMPDILKRAEKNRK